MKVVLNRERKYYKRIVFCPDNKISTNIQLKAKTLSIFYFLVIIN